MCQKDEKCEDCDYKWDCPHAKPNNSCYENMCNGPIKNEKFYVVNHLNSLIEHSEREGHSIYFKHVKFESDPGYIVVEWDKKQFIVRIEEV